MTRGQKEEAARAGSVAAASTIGTAKNQFEILQKRQYQMLLIQGVTVVALGMGFLGLSLFPGAFVIDPHEPLRLLSTPVVLRAGLMLLLLLFLAYVVMAHRQLIQLTRRLWEQHLNIELLNRRVVELRTLQDITRAVSARLEFKAVANLVMDSVFRLLRPRYAALRLVRPKPHDEAEKKLETVVERWSNLSADEEERLEPAAERWASSVDAAPELPPILRRTAHWVLQRGEPVILPLHPDKLPPDFPPELAKVTEPILAVPMCTGKEVLGVLSVAGSPGSILTENEQGLLSIFADQVASLLQHARLFEELQESFKKLKEAQQQTIQSTKMAAIGQLAAGVAHELNNPLGGILGCAQLLAEKARAAVEKKEMLDPSQFLSRLSLIERESGRAKEIVANLLRFSRAHPAERTKINVLPVIEETLKVTEHQLHLSKIEVIRNLPPSLPSIMGNANQLQQVFTNLILNARKAMSPGGRLTISAEAGEEDSRKVVRVAVADTGCGIPPENMERIFEPFFTTGKVGESTGLGLSISHSIVRDHGGEIRVQSEVGKGSCFTVVIPACPEDVPEPELPRNPSRDERKGG